ncbi:hypothetical protein BGW39_006678 [Mortierella sp. 14UC]|nr:hypothetical protein BGW39_006678 [Mortierella sp. 14UC]
MALHGGERAKSRLRERISVYDSEEEEDMKAMEEMNALVIDIPATMGWLQVIEQALSTFRSSFEVELQDSSDSDITHPIKAWANWNEDYGDTTYNKDPVKYSTSAATTRTKATPKGHPSLMPLSQSASSVDSPKLRHEREMIQVKHQMSASSLLTLQRLQSQHHHTQQLYQHQTQRRYSFLCTQGYHHHRQDALEEESSDSSSGSSSSSTTLLEAAILALCRFRDHVKSNLMDPALDEELESGLSRLGFGGDFGMVVAD